MEPESKAAPTPEERAEWQAPWTDQELEEHGLRSVLDNGNLFCGVRQESFAIGGVTYRFLPKSRIKWGITFSRLGQISAMDAKDAITQALKEISDNSDVSFEYTQSPEFANLYLVSVRLDGASGVLADCEIPPQNASTSNTRLRMRLDDSEGWVLSDKPQHGQIDFYRVFLHEALHGCGLGHQPSSVSGSALIQPVYSATIRNLQANDIAELQRRYGKSVIVVPPPPTTPVSGATFNFKRGLETFQVVVDYPSEQTVAVKVDIQKGDKKVTLSGQKPW